jgi:nucleoside-triphosphatase THEP1
MWLRMANLIILYGPKGLGKTTFLSRLAGYYQSLSLGVHGILSPAVFQQGEKTGINAKDLRTGEERPLALRRLTIPSTDSGELRFIFNSETVQWGQEVLAAALPADVFIVDEIGPLELTMGQGWQAAIDQVLSQQYSLGIVVLRESLHTLVKDIWPVTSWVEYQRGVPLNVFDQFLPGQGGDRSSIAGSDDFFRKG